MINDCARILKEHGPEYARWLGEHRSRTAPLQVLRAVLALPEPYGALPKPARVYVSRLVDCADTEHDEREFAWLQRERQLEIMVETAEQQRRETEVVSSALQARQRELEESASQLERELISHRAGADRLRQELAATRHQLAGEAAKSGAIIAAQRAELDRRAPIDAASLGTLLTAVDNDRGANRRTRREARKLLASTMQFANKR